MSEPTSAPIVLIHGLVGTLREPTLLESIGHQALAVNLLGYGENQHVEAKDIDLYAQVEHVRAWLEAKSVQEFHLVGHSVGGVVAALLAHKYPDQVLSFTSVEGNFTLKDAFMTAKIAAMTPDEATDMLRAYRDDPRAWLESKNISPNPLQLQIAELWFGNQPASTLQAQSASVIDITGKPSYLEILQAVFSHARPLHLIAGEHSRNGWDTPDWALAQADTFTIMPATGHFMMLEQPEQFGQMLTQLLHADE